MVQSESEPGQADRDLAVPLGESVQLVFHLVHVERQTGGAIADVLAFLHAVLVAQRNHLVRGRLDRRLHLLGSADTPRLEIDELHRVHHLPHRRLKTVVKCERLGAFSPRGDQLLIGLLAASLARDAYLLHFLLGVLLPADRPVRASLEVLFQLGHPVECVKAVVPLFSIGEDLGHPPGDPLGRVLDDRGQIQPLRLGHPEHLFPILSRSALAQRQRKQVAAVQIHPRQHRVPLRKHLVERPGPNSLPWAFQAAVFSDSLAVVGRVTDRIDASAVMVNDHTAFRVDWMPFAGLRRSGLGVGGIPHTFHDMQSRKLIVTYGPAVSERAV